MGKGKESYGKIGICFRGRGFLHLGKKGREFRTQRAVAD